MKFIIFFLALNSISALACQNKIDPKKVMMFIDTNNSEVEIQKFENAACLRGERAVIVPNNYKEFTPMSMKFEKSNQALKTCKKTKKDCTKLETLQKADYEKLKIFKDTQPDIDVAIKNSLIELRKEGAKLHNFTISGHDGGGFYGGNKSYIRREEIADILKDFADINEVESALLLGCYTGVKSEVIAWKKIFPKIRLIAGYDGKGPLADRPQGHQFILDMLTKEKELIKQSDQKKLQTYTNKSLTVLGALDAGLYVKPYCENPANEEEFYYGAVTTSKVFTNFSMKECPGKVKEIEEIQKGMEKYFSGEVEPPKDTNGDIRKWYNKARVLEHCILGLEFPMDVSQIFNLLFFENVKKNFANYYKDDLKIAESLLAKLQKNKLELGFKRSHESLEKYIKEEEGTLAKFEKDPAAYLQGRDENIASYLKYLKEEIKNDKSGFLQKLLDGETVDDSQVPRSAQSDIYNFRSSLKEFNQRKELLATHKEDPELTRKFLQNKVDEAHKWSATKNLEMQEIKDKKILQSIWLPTEKNLAVKTRKEILQNIHNMTKIMNYTEDSERRAIGWASNSMSQSFLHMENPFSWHDYNGISAAPDYAQQLE